MLDTIWAFLGDPRNRTVLGWIGGGVVVVAGGLWAVVKYFAKPKKAAAGAHVEAKGGGVAIGRDAVNSPINTAAEPPSRRP